MWLKRSGSEGQSSLCQNPDISNVFDIGFYTVLCLIRSLDPNIPALHVAWSCPKDKLYDATRNWSVFSGYMYRHMGFGLLFKESSSCALKLLSELNLCSVAGMFG